MLLQGSSKKVSVLANVGKSPNHHSAERLIGRSPPDREGIGGEITHLLEGDDNNSSSNSKSKQRRWFTSSKHSARSREQSVTNTVLSQGNSPLLKSNSGSSLTAQKTTSSSPQLQLKLSSSAHNMISVSPWNDRDRGCQPAAPKLTAAAHLPPKSAVKHTRQTETRENDKLSSSLCVSVLAPTSVCSTSVTPKKQQQ